MDELNRRILQLEIEETALAKETDESSRKRLEAYVELATLREQMDQLRRRWESEKSIDDIQKLRKELVPPEGIMKSHSPR